MYVSTCVLQQNAELTAQRGTDTMLLDLGSNIGISVFIFFFSNCHKRPVTMSHHKVVPHSLTMHQLTICSAASLYATALLFNGLIIFFEFLSRVSKTQQSVCLSVRHSTVLKQIHNYTYRQTFSTL